MNKKEFVNNYKHGIEKKLHDLGQTAVPVDNRLEDFYEDYMESSLEKEKDDYQALMRALQDFGESYVSIEDWEAEFDQDGIRAIKCKVLSGFGGPTIWFKVRLQDDEFEVIDTYHSWANKDIGGEYGIGTIDILWLEYNSSMLFEQGLMLAEQRA